MFARYRRTAAFVAFTIGAITLGGCNEVGSPSASVVPAAPAVAASPHVFPAPGTQPDPPRATLPIAPIAKAPSGPALFASVTDEQTGRAIAASSVIVSPSLYATAVVPKTLSGEIAQTDANGNVRLGKVSPGSYYLEIFAPGHVPLHRHITVQGDLAELGKFALTTLTSEEATWLDQVNRDRARWHMPPLVPDEATVETARYRAATMGNNGFFAHDCPASVLACLTASDFEARIGAALPGGAENIGAQTAGSWNDVEASMLAEAAACGGSAPERCAFSEDTGHFLNIVNPSYRFVGLASYHHGRSFAASFGDSVDYYDMEFV